MRRLVPCPRCQRHVRAADTTCPHCGQSSGALTFAAFAVGATLALTGCGERPVAAVYGPPAIDPSQRATSTDTTASTSDADAPAPPMGVYGPPPVSPEDRQPEPPPTASNTTPPPPATPPSPTTKPTAPSPTTKPTGPTAPPGPSVIPLYGPPPRDPTTRTPN